jgi:hypothetical protein
MQQDGTVHATNTEHSAVQMAIVRNVPNMSPEHPPEANSSCTTGSSSSDTAVTAQVVHQYIEAALLHQPEHSEPSKRPQNVCRECSRSRSQPHLRGDTADPTELPLVTVQHLRSANMASVPKLPVPAHSVDEMQVQARTSLCSTAQLESGADFPQLLSLPDPCACEKAAVQISPDTLASVEEAAVVHPMEAVQDLRMRCAEAAVAESNSPFRVPESALTGTAGSRSVQSADDPSMGQSATPYDVRPTSSAQAFAL